jgi:DNA-binding sugar fermentation-stimulating protein
VVTSLDVLTIESLVREGQEAVVVFLVLRHAFHKLP